MAGEFVRPPLRRLLVPGILALAILAAQRPLGRLCDAVAARIFAREALASLGLEPTPAQIALHVRAQGQSHAGPPEVSLPAAASLPPMDALRARPFAPGLDYGRLYDGGRVTIAVCAQFGAEHHLRFLADPRWAELLRRRAIELTICGGTGDLQAALDAADIVIFSGHANRGWGLDPETTRAPDRFLRIEGASRLPLPEHGLSADETFPFDRPSAPGGQGPSAPRFRCRCKVFVYLGCRTELHYRKALEERFPGTVFVLTNYVLSTGSLDGYFLRTLTAGLARGEPLARVLEAWEDPMPVQILYGRSYEQGRLGRKGPFPGCMFTGPGGR